MVDQCFKKCVGHYKESKLNVGESTCVDRCVHKYWGAHTLVQEILQVCLAPAHMTTIGPCLARSM